ncbi:hypothetical protein C8R44DRAFT_748639 [Mycena epipterygia]|nr:hypothetical protein C8R44DRAFT_748639 [Mycena epipterygia]
MNRTTLPPTGTFGTALPGKGFIAPIWGFLRSRQRRRIVAQVWLRLGVGNGDAHLSLIYRIRIASLEAQLNRPRSVPRVICAVHLRLRKSQQHATHVSATTLHRLETLLNLYGKLRHLKPSVPQMRRNECRCGAVASNDDCEARINCAVQMPVRHRRGWQADKKKRESAALQVVEFEGDTHLRNPEKPNKQAVDTEASGSLAQELGEVRSHVNLDVVDGLVSLGSICHSLAFSGVTSLLPLQVLGPRANMSERDIRNSVRCRRGSSAFARAPSASTTHHPQG